MVEPNAVRCGMSLPEGSGRVKKALNHSTFQIIYCERTAKKDDTRSAGRLQEGNRFGEGLARLWWRAEQSRRDTSHGNKKRPEAPDTLMGFYVCT